MGLFDKKPSSEDQNAAHLTELLDTVNKLSSELKSIQTVMDNKINGLSEIIKGFKETQNSIPLQTLTEKTPEPEPRLEDLSEEQLEQYSRRDLIMLQNEQSKKDFESQFSDFKKSTQIQFDKRDASSAEQQMINKFKTFTEAKDPNGNLLYPDNKEWLPEVASVYRQSPSLELHEALNIAKGRNPEKRKQTDLKFGLNQPAPNRDAFGGFPGDSSSPTEESETYTLNDATMKGVQDEVDKEGGFNPLDQQF